MDIVQDGVKPSNSIAQDIALLVETSELPVFQGKSVEDHAETWTQVDKSLRQHQWLLAAIAASLTTKYGEADVRSFAALVGCQKDYVYKLAKTYKAFEKYSREYFSHKLSFSHYKIAAQTDNPEEILMLADENQWSVRELENHVFNKEQIAPKSKSVEVPIAEFVHTQETIRQKEALEKEVRTLKADNARLLNVFNDELAKKDVSNSHLNVLSSKSEEWYTPPEYIEAARLVLGQIDIDPASNETAQEVIQAAVYYTKETNGLDKDWIGKLWLNPPWGQICGEFVTKAVQDYENGDVSEAILLLNSNSNDTLWWQPLWNYTLCFTKGRINFYNNDGEASGSTHGSCFVYLGNNKNTFREVFKQYGAIVRRYQ